MRRPVGGEIPDIAPIAPLFVRLYAGDGILEKIIGIEFVPLESSETISTRACVLKI
jgi:hypothetical protein